MEHSVNTSKDPQNSNPEPPQEKKRLLIRVLDRFVYLVWHQVMRTQHPGWERFFALRCPHLAGMIAYFGILSIIPAAFICFSLLAQLGLLDNQGWIVEQIKTVIPGSGTNTILNTVESMRNNSGSLGIVGIAGLIWATSNFFSCIESALNIIYGVNNRLFFFQKLWVLLLMLGALVGITVATLIITVALPTIDALDKAAEKSVDFPLPEGGLTTILISSAIAFLFFLSCYRFLPNTKISTREVWRGALIATVGFEFSIRLLPMLVAQDRGGAVLSAFAGIFIVMMWFYIVAFLMLIGGAYNWWWREKQKLS